MCITLFLDFPCILSNDSVLLLDPHMVIDSTGGIMIGLDELHLVQLSIMLRTMLIASMVISVIMEVITTKVQYSVSL